MVVTQHWSKMTVPKPNRAVNDPILKELIDRLVAAYQPLRLYLFGSRARGTQKNDSDYDILIIVDDNVPDEFKSATLAYKSLWGMHAAFDVLVWTNQEFKNRLHIPNSLPAEVIREGLLIHVA
jgi:predicted nucleotidyltransferase